MRSNLASERSFVKPLIIVFAAVAALAAVLFPFSGTLRRLGRESLMARVTSAHYEILAPAEALSAAAMEQLAAQRETVFTGLNKRLGNGASNAKVRVVLDPAYSEGMHSATGEQPYSVSGTTVRTKLIAQSSPLAAAADAEALLFAAWGKPGNSRIGRWTAIWLTGDWHGLEIGMAAAGVEQKLGYKKLDAILSDSPSQINSADDQELLGAAWISEVAEFGGADAVRRLYLARMKRPNVADVTKALGTPPLELEREWQMWTYAYLAGMPPMPHSSAMPMDMPTEGSH